MQETAKPIRTRHPLTTPDGVDRAAVSAWVRRWTVKRVRLDDPSFQFGSFDANDAASRKQRTKVMKFAKVLQAELLHFENWDGTARG